MDEIKVILLAKPDAAKEKTERRNTPLHVLYSYSARTEEMAKHLVDANA